MCKKGKEITIAQATSLRQGKLHAHYILSTVRKWGHIQH